MPAQKSAHHPTWTQSFEDRSFLPDTSTLTAFLLRLIAHKRTNLCVSADVSTASELISLAEEVGDSICLLKTHADAIFDFNERTVRRLRELARRKQFLIFEDRKFGDIGNTVQKQYTSGPLRIALWAEIVNAHVFPGPAIIRALKEAAEATIATYNLTVHTEISGGGTPESSPSNSPSPPSTPREEALVEDGEHNDGSVPTLEPLTLDLPPARFFDRKMSVVSVQTTITTHTEPLSPQPTPGFHMADFRGVAPEPAIGSGTDSADGYDGNAAPFLRGLLLLAEMSSEGNLLTPEYTAQCAKMARQHRDFVIGFIAQRALNNDSADNFITMTPGVESAAAWPESATLKGDGLGQQYRTPRTVVLDDGCDVIIVGRGIVNAEDRTVEAERYRQEAWKAYEERIGR